MWRLPACPLAAPEKWRGIAIGPILFVIAILAVLVMALSSGMGSFNGNTTVDRIKSDVRGQANLIRAKVQECYMTTMGNEGSGWPPGFPPNGVAVKNLECPGDPPGLRNFWTGKRPTSLPPTPIGFKDWIYINEDRGRCLRLDPASQPVSATMQEGLAAVSKYFGAQEIFLDPSDWSLSLWLTPLDKPVKCDG